MTMIMAFLALAVSVVKNVMAAAGRQGEGQQGGQAQGGQLLFRHKNTSCGWIGSQWLLTLRLLTMDWMSSFQTPS